jgi:hypothetical protein
MALLRFGTTSACVRFAHRAARGPRARLAFLCLLAACTPTKSGIRASGKSIATAGTRCASQGGKCTCRRLDDQGEPMDPADFDEGAPPEGYKRFEIRTGRGENPIAVSVDPAGELAKGADSPEPACAYFDLAPGKHTVRMHAEAVNPELGQEPAFYLYEHSPEQKSWYKTFSFRCGGGSDRCTLGHMEEWLGETRHIDRGIYDKCGSTRVTTPRWEATRQVGTTAATGLVGLEVELTLEVYKFKPRFPHGAKTCKGLSPTGSE